MIGYDISSFIRAFIGEIPGHLGSYLRKKGIPYLSIGKEVSIQRSFWVDYPEFLSIGNRVQINQHCLINAGGGVDIGNDVLIGPYVIIYSQNHKYMDANTLVRLQDYSRKKVIIEDDVWIGARVTVLPGVKLRKGSVVAAGAVVTKTTEEYAIVAGIPAKKIKNRTIK